MNFLKNLKIKYRILIAVIIPILITASVISLVTIQQIEANGNEKLEVLESNLIDARKDSLKNIVDTAISTVEQVKKENLSESTLKTEVINRLRAIQYDNSNYIFVYERAAPPYNFKNLAYNPDPTKEGLVSANNSKLQELFIELFEVAESPEEDFYSYEWPNPSNNGNVEKKISYAVMLPELDLMIGTGLYVSDIQTMISDVENNLAAKTNKIIITLLISTTIVVFISILIGYFVSRTVTTPIKNIIEIMPKIVKGDGDLTERLPENGKNELSELGKEFNLFVKKIQNIIQEVNSVTQQVAASSEELSGVSNETKNNIEKQNSETDQIASAINEMAATIHQISQNANEVQSHSSDADRIAKEGGKTMEASQETINKLSNSIVECSTVIESLAARSNEIQSILDVIHDVTEQTNLLALNAAIEAARAGEHGRGFAVVADEVRNLAKRSDQSASKIRTMIDTFIDESENAVGIMRVSKELSDETVERINHSANSLQTIEKSVEEIMNQITQIAAGSEQQSQVAEEVNQNIIRIVEASQNSKNGIEQTSEASEELAKLSENLKVLVEQFRT